MNNYSPRLAIVVLSLVVTGNLCSCRSDRALAKRNRNHQKNHYYVRGRSRSERNCFWSSPRMQQLEINTFFEVIGAIAHSHRS